MDNYQNLTESDCQWIELIRRCRTSGKTDCQWLEENNIKPSSFYWHIRKLKAKSCEIPKNVKRRNPETNEVVPWMKGSAGIEQLLPWSDFVKEHCSGLIDVESITAENHPDLPVK